MLPKQGGISHRSVGRNSVISRVHRHMKASFCTAKCDISPSHKDRTVPCSGSIAAVFYYGLLTWYT